MLLLAYRTPDVETLLVDGATELLERQSNPVHSSVWMWSTFAKCLDTLLVLPPSHAELLLHFRQRASRRVKFNHLGAAFSPPSPPCVCVAAWSSCVCVLPRPLAHRRGERSLVWIGKIENTKKDAFFVLETELATLKLQYNVYVAIIHIFFTCLQYR